MTAIRDQYLIGGDMALYSGEAPRDLRTQLRRARWELIAYTATTLFAQNRAEGALEGCYWH